MLCLDGTQVTDAGLEHLKGLTRLQSLDLSGTQVTDAGLEHLKGLTQLQWLSLEGTQVTDAGLEHLKGLTNSKHCPSVVPRSPTLDWNISRVVATRNIGTRRHARQRQRCEETATGVAELRHFPLIPPQYARRERVGDESTARGRGKKHPIP